MDSNRESSQSNIQNHTIVNNFPSDTNKNLKNIGMNQIPNSYDKNNIIPNTSNNLPIYPIINQDVNMNPIINRFDHNKNNFPFIESQNPIGDLQAGFQNLVKNPIKYNNPLGKIYINNLVDIGKIHKPENVFNAPKNPFSQNFDDMQDVRIIIC
jgi:hypothetical protein